MDRSAGALAALVAAAGLDPGAGLQVADATRLATLPVDPGIPLIVLRGSASPEASLPGRHAHAGALGLLVALYPPAHLLRELPAGGSGRLDTLDAERLAGGDWLVPALEPIENLASPHGLPWISARLRAPDGCPWDRRQDHASLRRYLLEEAYETVDAIERGDPSELAGELGDVLLQVVLHAQLAAEEGAFDLTDVYRSIGAKIVRRHPHVFAGVQVSGVEQVARNWETIKSAERAESMGAGESPEEPFDRVTRVLPALPASRELQDRVSALGWDWPSLGGVWEKLEEELAELRSAADGEARLHELGDLLFVIVNLARWLELDPEEALRRANRRWIDRLRAVERLAADRGLVIAQTSPEEKDRLWEAAKAEERPHGG